MRRMDRACREGTKIGTMLETTSDLWDSHTQSNRATDPNSQDLIMQYSVEIPGYNDLYSATGLNLDKASAYLFHASAFATFNDLGRLNPPSTTAAKRARESGAVRVNGEVHKGLRYSATPADVKRGYFSLGIGKRSRDGGKGYEMPIGVMGHFLVDRV